MTLVTVAVIMSIKDINKQNEIKYAREGAEKIAESWDLHNSITDKEVYADVLAALREAIVKSIQASSMDPRLLRDSFEETGID